MSAASWGEFEAASPELARMGQGLFDETGLVMLGTVRRDGSPRVSPVESFIFAGELYLGMIWQSYKALDLQRDPRCMVMNTVHDRMLKDGEFKIGIVTASFAKIENDDWSRLFWRAGDQAELALGG